MLSIEVACHIKILCCEIILLGKKIIIFGEKKLKNLWKTHTHTLELSQSYLDEIEKYLKPQVFILPLNFFPQPECLRTNRISLVTWWFTTKRERK